MKKLFLVLLCAGLFVACGNKNKDAEQCADTTAAEVIAEPAPVEEPVVAEEAPAQEQAAPAKQTSKPKQTVKQHAQSAAENVANTAIDKAESEATQQVVNTGKKRR
ncbi:MAG: hypothetical protein K5636_03615 [Bacteroidales bacterium]|nr:hypothetical protein [Bacteroidales bacterium]